MSYSYLEKVAEKQKKFTLAGYSACPVAVDLRWF